MLSIFKIPVLGSLMLIATCAMAQSPLEHQRALYNQAELALKKGKTTEFLRLKDQLKGYVLYPYLEYASLERRLNQLTLNDINTFQNVYDAPYLAEKLRTNWLIRQAQANRWNEVHQGYKPSGKPHPELVCHYAHSNLVLYPNKEKTQADIRALWLSPKMHPSACNTLFKSWQQARQLSPNLVWERVELAFDANQLKVVQSIRSFLPSNDQSQLDHWIKLHKQSQYVASFPSFSNTPVQRRILVDSIKQLFRKNPELALKLWPKLQEHYNLSDHEKGKISAFAGLQLAWQHHPQARQWLSSVPASLSNLMVVEWRLRSDIRASDWKDVLKAYSLLPESARTDEKWIYWKARALEKLGRQDEADPLYESIAQQRHFYGFLASERLGQPAAYNHKDALPTQEVLKQVKNSGTMARIREFNATGRESRARAEWFGTLEHLSDPELVAWSKIAKDNDWHNLAIMTIAKSNSLDDIKMRFPMVYQDHIERHADKNNLDPAMIFALSRQESAFRDNALSPVGAMGLMQLMPRTASHVSRQAGIHYKHKSEILEPHLNIALGSAYFRTLLKSLSNHPILATAAYNAGPSNVNKWLPQQHLDVDQWIESIPFYETRNYVTNVFAYLSIYRHLLGQETALLDLPKVQARNTMFHTTTAPLSTISPYVLPTSKAVKASSTKKTKTATKSKTKAKSKHKNVAIAKSNQKVKAKNTAVAKKKEKVLETNAVKKVNPELATVAKTPESS